MAAASEVRSTLGIAVVAAAIALLGCGDLLQEPDTGVSPADLRLEALSGGGQTGEPGAALQEPVRVQVFDGADRPMARLWVQWTGLEGSGTPQPRHTFTDGDGIAETTWILGSSTGPQTIQAFARGGAAITLTATAAAP